jgi:hypothetical protein
VTAPELAERQEDRAVESGDLGAIDWDFVPADTRRWAEEKVRQARTIDHRPYDQARADEECEALRRYA